MSGVLLTVVVVMARKIAQERVRATYFSKIITPLGVIVLDRSPGLPLELCARASPAPAGEDG
jgi:hypothetical protein